MTDTPRRRGRPAVSHRVPDMDPHEVALTFARQCALHGKRSARLLAPTLIAHEASDEELVGTAIYKRVRHLVDYAVRGVGLRSSLSELVDPLRLFAGGPLVEAPELDALADMVNTAQTDNDPLIMVLATARARERIGMGQAVDASDLSLLSGMTRGAVLNAAKRGELKPAGEGKPGHPTAVVFSAAEARRWLATRGALGFHS